MNRNQPIFFDEQRDGRNFWLMIPHARFEALQRSGRAVFVEGEWV